MPPIISLHLPKSGGTSVRQSIERQFGTRAFFDYGRGPLGPDAEAVADGMPENCEIVHGHFRPARYDAVPDAFRFTFLRHPVDLLVSFYFFWRDLAPTGQILHHQFLTERPSIETFALWPEMQRFSSRTVFGGYDMGRFDFIGFHERRATDIMTLNELTGLSIEPDRHENRTEGGSAERLALRQDASRMRNLYDTLRDDVRFYETLRARRD